MFSSLSLILGLLLNFPKGRTPVINVTRLIENKNYQNIRYKNVANGNNCFPHFLFNLIKKKTLLYGSCDIAYSW